ncbi:hypothetical protein ACO0K7_07530 [Undibacterium sp. Ji67W]
MAASTFLHREKMMTTEYIDTIQFTKWWLKNPQGNEQVMAAFRAFVKQINETEPGTFTYLMYTPNLQVANQPSQVPTELFFIESYASPAAFSIHVDAFVKAISDPYKASFYPYAMNTAEPLVLTDCCARFRPTSVSAPCGFIRPDGFKHAQITQNASWWVKPEKNKHELLNALYEFSLWVKKNEPGTLMYFFTNPEQGKTAPPAPEGEINFIAAYQNEQAQTEHYANWNARFLSKYKDYFVASCNDPSVPFIEEQNLRFFDGFIRQKNWD